jgi:hypothetical protein
MGKREYLLLAIFAAALAWQCLLPGFIGLANNGDFGKMAGQVCIGGVDNGADNFLFFVSDYLRDQRFCWDSLMRSSELWFDKLASGLSKTFGDPVRFDIRWIGLLHALGFFWAFLPWVSLIRPLEGWRWLLAAAGIAFVLTDVGIVSYSNTFYTDTPALIGAIAAIALGALLLRDGFRTGTLVWFTLACFLVVTSKPSHALAGLIPVAWLFWRRTWTSAAAAFVILSGIVWAIALTPPWYKNNNFFTVIFFKLLPQSSSQASDAQELLIEPIEMKYVGMHAFMPGSPVENPVWVKHWQERVTTSRLLWFYLLHPASVLRSFWQDLNQETWQRRPVNLSNFQRFRGREAGARTNAFGWWSAMRTALFRIWPAHIVFWYIGAAVIGIWRRNWILPAVLFGGGLEFSAASLTDAAETYRHLLLFQVYTDLSILIAGIMLAQAWKATHKFDSSKTDNALPRAESSPTSAA